MSDSSSLRGLPPTWSELPPAALAPLLLRHQQQQPLTQLPPAEAYLARYPQLDSESQQDLIVNEFLLRLADAPDRRPLTEEFLERFPAHAGALSEQLACLDVLVELGCGDALTAPATGSRDEPPAAAEGEMVGRYLIRARLGEGGMGVVFRATDTELGRDVAIKFPKRHSLRQEDRRDLQAARIKHAHVCQVYDVGVHEQSTYVVMELTGRSLDQWLAGRRLSTEQAVELTAQVADGLAAVHRARIIHRDVKPGNILIDDDGTPKISDFGLAWFEEPDPSSVAGMMSGTRKYMAPEVMAGRREQVGPASDIYSLAAVLCELLHGRTALPDMEPATQSEAVLRHLLSRALSAHPADRPQDAAEFAEALRGWLELRSSLEQNRGGPRPLPRGGFSPWLKPLQTHQQQQRGELRSNGLADATLFVFAGSTAGIAALLAYAVMTIWDWSFLREQRAWLAGAWGLAVAAPLHWQTWRALSRGVLNITRGDVMVALSTALLTSTCFLPWAGPRDALIAGAVSLLLGMLTLWRLPHYLWGSVWQLLVLAVQRATRRDLLRFSPLAMDETTLLPLPGLESHLVAASQRGSLWLPRLLQACRRCPGQRRIGRRVRSRLLAEKISSLLEAGRFSELAFATASAGPEFKPLLAPLTAAAREIVLARQARSEQRAAAAHHRAREHWSQFQRSVHASSAALAEAVRPRLPVLCGALEQAVETPAN